MTTERKRGVGLKCRVSGLLLDNNSVELHQASLNDPDCDLDCCLLGVLNWGHNARAQIARRNLEQEFPADDLYGPVDFAVNMSRRNLTLTNQHLWLKPSDTDWHRPIIVTHPGARAHTVA